MYTSVLPACMYEYHVPGWHLCLEKGIGASGTGVGTGNWTWVIWNNKRSWQLSPPSSPGNCILNQQLCMRWLPFFRHSISYKGCFLSPCGISLFLLFQLTQSGCVPVSSPTSSEFLRSHPMNGAAWHRETHPDDRGQEPTILNQPSGGGGQLEIKLLLSDFIKIRT